RTPLCGRARQGDSRADSGGAPNAPEGGRQLRRARRLLPDTPARNHGRIARGGEQPMSNERDLELSRRDFVQGAVSGAALAAVPLAAFAAPAQDADKAAVLAQIPKMHAANIKRLQEWIALPSIAAENRNFPQGPEHMAKLAQEAGFTGVKLIPTAGKPGVFGKIDAGASTTMAIYFMYDVKQ